MTTIATLAVKLIADANGFTTMLDQAEQKTQAWSTNVSKNLKEAGDKISGFGTKMSAFVTTPILGAGLAAINLASDMQETQSKVGVVFGEMSADVMAWSETSATALGMSREQALGAAATYGNLFVSLGLGQKPAADMSTSLVQLASDLASFNNANPQEVLDALRSGLSGEIEPLKKFGVAMNETILTQKAMELGMGDNIQALTEAQKLQLRYAVIMDQTATAQGDFARTSEGLANQQRILKAQFLDAGAALGQKLLPYALQFVQWVSGLIAKFQALTPEQQKWILILAGVAAAIGPVLVVVGSLVTGIGAIIGVIGAITAPMLIVVGVILLIIGVLALLYMAWTNNWGGIQEKTAAVIAFVQGLIQGGMQFIEDLTSGKLGWVSQLWSNFTTTLMTIINTFITNVKLVFQAFQAAFNGDWHRFGELMRQVWDNTWKMIGTILSNSWNNFRIVISTAVTSIINFFKNTDWGQVGRNIVEGIANGISNGASAIANAAMAAAQAALQAVQGFLGIQSPSTVFEQQVGWQMAAGTAEGWNQGLDRMLRPSFGSLVPEPVGAVNGQPAVVNRGAGQASVEENRVIELLEEIADKEAIDYDKLARIVRDAVLMRSQ